MVVSKFDNGGLSVIESHLFILLLRAGEKPVPFQRAIAQSIGYGPTATAEEAEEMFRKT